MTNMACCVVLDVGEKRKNASSCTHRSVPVASAPLDPVDLDQVQGSIQGTEALHPPEKDHGADFARNAETG